MNARIYTDTREEHRAGGMSNALREVLVSNVLDVLEVFLGDHGFAVIVEALCDCALFNSQDEQVSDSDRIIARFLHHELVALLARMGRFEAVVRGEYDQLLNEKAEAAQ